VKTSVTTLIHNRHAKYRNSTESRLRSTSDQPPYVPSTSHQRQSMPLELVHPLTPKSPTGSSITVTASVTTLFHNPHAKYRKYTESRLRSTTDQPPYVPSTSGQRQSMPLKLRHALTPKKRPEIAFPVTTSVTTLCITITLNTGNTQKFGFVRRPISLRMSHRHPVKPFDAPETPAHSDAEKPYRK
jgi:hypothetical protein